jgi:myo-inositol 2-dehydrogenase/D-chiro-inositol 1-dehydrogenase
MVSWFGDRVISGDIVVEQNIHVIDMANWYLGARPLKANGTGGRTSWAGMRNEFGDALRPLRRYLLVPRRRPRQLQFGPIDQQVSRPLCTRDGYPRCGRHPLRWPRAHHRRRQGKLLDRRRVKGGCVSNIKTFVESIKASKPINNVATAVERALRNGRGGCHRGECRARRSPW